MNSFLPPKEYPTLVHLTLLLLMLTLLHFTSHHDHLTEWRTRTDWLTACNISLVFLFFSSPDPFDHQHVPHHEEFNSCTKDYRIIISRHSCFTILTQISFLPFFPLLHHDMTWTQVRGFVNSPENQRMDMLFQQNFNILLVTGFPSHVHHQDSDRTLFRSSTVHLMDPGHHLYPNVSNQLTYFKLLETSDE